MAYGIPAGGFIGSPLPWSDGSALDTGYSDGSDWFFQMVFCATTCSIVSGTLAERIKIWPFFIFCALLTGFIYPIEMGWQWGGGYLAEAGFSDFAGSTLVHSAGAAAALAGAILLGPRLGRFTDSGEATPMEPFANSSIPLATLGVFILWLGWFGFNGGSQLAMGTFDDVTAVATIYINTNLAAGAGVMACAVISRLVTGKTDVVMMLNGALGGLVAITAEPLAPSPFFESRSRAGKRHRRASQHALRWGDEGKFQRFHRLSERVVAWRRSDLDRWIADHQADGEEELKAG